MTRDEMAHCQGALQVRAELHVNVGFRKVDERARSVIAGVVDHDVEPSELFECRRDDALGTVPIRNAVAARDGIAAARHDLRGDCTGGVARRRVASDGDTEVIHHYSCAVRSQRQGVFATETTARTSHERDSALERSHDDRRYT